MIAKYNRWSFVFGVPGVALQIAASCMLASHQRILPPLGCLSLMFGTVLLLIGLAFYAKAKAQSPAWCAAGLLSVLGLLLLLLLEDKSKPTCGAGDEHEKA